MQLNPQAVAVVAGALSVLVIWFIAEAIRWQRGRTTSAYMHDVLDRLNEAVVVGVRYTQQTVVDAMKKASSDGKLTAGQAKEALTTAYDITAKQLGKTWFATAERVFDSTKLDAIIRARIESAVADQPRRFDLGNTLNSSGGGA